MDKYDIKKAHRGLYAPGKDFTQVDVPEFGYLAVEGHGDPNTSPDYAEAVEALYATAYTIKFDSKQRLGRDFVVGPLEGLWYAEDMSTFVSRDKDAWSWTMLIAQPDWITEDLITAGVTAAVAKKGLPALDRVRPRRLAEGRCVQTLHVGSYDDEGPVLDRMHNTYLPANGLTFNGAHHEIYLGDPRRTPAEKLKTVLRQPVRPI